MGIRTILKVKKKGKETITNKIDIINTAENFYNELYSSPGAKTSVSVLKLLNQGSEEIPEITEQEILSALRDIKDNRARGEDHLVIGTIKKGNKGIIKALKTLF